MRHSIRYGLLGTIVLCLLLGTISSYTKQPIIISKNDTTHELFPELGTAKDWTDFNSMDLESKIVFFKGSGFIAGSYFTIPDYISYYGEHNEDTVTHQGGTMYDKMSSWKAHERGILYMWEDRDFILFCAHSYGYQGYDIYGAYQRVINTACGDLVFVKPNGMVLPPTCNYSLKEIRDIMSPETIKHYPYSKIYQD